jgi:hypothetical protein
VTGQLPWKIRILIETDSEHPSAPGIHPPLTFSCQKILTEENDGIDSLPVILKEPPKGCHLSDVFFQKLIFTINPGN